MRGFAIRPRAIASICCSPPDSSPARLVSRSRSRGKRVEQRRDLRSVVGVLAGVRAEDEIVHHGQFGKHLSAFRHQRQPAPGDAVRIEALDRRVVENNVALDRTQQSRDRAHGGRLAGAVGADQGDHFARPNVEG